MNRIPEDTQQEQLDLEHEDVAPVAASDELREACDFEDMPCTD